MSKSTVTLIAALVLLGIAQPASALSKSEPLEPPFQFNFSHSEFAAPASARALEARLSREARNYCRTYTADGQSPVMAYGCRRSVIRAARTALARARAGRG